MPLMSELIPPSLTDLLERKVLANLACHLADGSILVNPVWCAAEGDTILINSAQGRLKDRAIRRNPQVTVMLHDPENPYRYLEVRGRVTEITTEGADALIDRLAQKYMGVEKYPMHRAGEVRVTYRIAPEKVVARDFRPAPVGATQAQ
jgi:PPOX class probable F420-dependent enzyme